MALKLTHPRKVLQLISTAKGLLQAPNAWTRYTMARNKDQQPVDFTDANAQMFCLAGALHRANVDLGMPPEVVAEAEVLVNQVCIGTYEPIISKHGSKEDIWEFHLYPISYTNDALIHTQKNAQGLLEKIHALLDKRIGKAVSAPAAPAPAPVSPAVPTPPMATPGTPVAPPPPAPPATPETSATLPPLEMPAAPATPAAPPPPAPAAAPEPPATLPPLEMPAAPEPPAAPPPPEPPAAPEPPAPAQTPAAGAPGMEIVQDPVQHHPAEQQAAEAEDEDKPAPEPELPKIDLPGIEIDMDLDEPA